jgi:molybdopterin-guanine dinucleotide biosynthesis protein A
VVNRNDLKDVTLAILAGGEGSRMGKPKAELRVRGVPILQYLLQQFSWPGPTLLVTAPGRSQPPGGEWFNRKATDSVAGQGPLRGVLTAIEHATTERVVIATVDMPGIDLAQLRWLVDQLASDSLGVITRRATASGEQIEPFPLVVRTVAATTIRRRLEENARSVHALQSESGFVVAVIPPDWPESTWINLNEPGDYEAFVRSME